MTPFQGKKNSLTSLPVTLAGDSGSHRARDAPRFKALSLRKQMRGKKVSERGKKKAKTKLIGVSQMIIYVHEFNSEITLHNDAVVLHLKNNKEHQMFVSDL